MGTILQTKHLSKSFGELKAVDDVSLTLNQGEIFGFLGPNGAGKTTTIGMILGLIYPDQGQIRVFGKSVSPKMPDGLSKVGALFGGSPAFYPYLSAYENIQLIARIHQLEKRDRIFEVLDQVGLSDAKSRLAKNLSTGMKQRLALGMALVHKPELLILDEPTSGLDPNGTRFVRELLRSLSKQGITIFLSSHRLHEVEQICERVAVLNRGKIIKKGYVSDLCSQPDVLEISVLDVNRAKKSLTDLKEIQFRECKDHVLRVAGYQKEKLIRHLVDDGIIPTAVKEVHQNLEDLFSNITKKECE